MNITADSLHCEDESLFDGLFVSETMWMAKTVIETRQIWSEGWGRHFEPNQKGTRMIEKWKFERGAEPLEEVR